MTNLVSDRQKHEAQAALCDRQLTVEEALVASHRLTDLETVVSEAAVACLENYEAFGFWANDVEKRWSYKPDLYHPETHAAIRVLRRQWFGLFGRLVGLMDDQSCRGLNIKRAEDARKAYAIMLSIEQMDHSELPEHMGELADKALEEYAAGHGEEMLR